MRLGGKDEAIEYQSFSQLGKTGTVLASHVDTRYWYQWPAALAQYLPQKGKRRSSEANGGAWVNLENAGKLLPPRTCLGLSASAFISRHDHYPGAYEGARFQWGGEKRKHRVSRRIASRFWRYFWSFPSQLKSSPAYKHSLIPDARFSGPFGSTQSY